jgi:hypothetical protein
MPNVKLEKKLYSYLNKTDKSIQIFLAPENGENNTQYEDIFHHGSNVADAFVIRCTGGHVENLTHVLNIDPDECMVFYGNSQLCNCVTRHICVWKESLTWYNNEYQLLPAEDRQYFQLISH